MAKRRLGRLATRAGPTKGTKWPNRVEIAVPITEPTLQPAALPPISVVVIRSLPQVTQTTDQRNHEQPDEQHHRLRSDADGESLLALQGDGIGEAIAGVEVGGDRHPPPIVEPTGAGNANRHAAGRHRAKPDHRI